MRVWFQRLALAGLFIFSSPGWADQPVAVEIKRLSMETALKMARAAIGECRKQGIQIGVVVMVFAVVGMMTFSTPLRSTP